ncbi:MAG: nucleoside-diphosphate sugar epimerase/dehydratase, partial [Anaerolineales bacterium]
MKKKLMEFSRATLKITPFKRRTVFFLADIFLIAFAMYASFWIRFDGNIPEIFFANLKYYILLVLAIKLGFLMYYNMYDISWRFFSLRESLNLFKAIALSSVSLGLLLFFLKTYAPFREFPRSVILLDFIFSLIFISALRISKRALRENLMRTGSQSKGRTRILIIGAGSAGEQIGREMLNNAGSAYFPVGYIDDDPAKKSINIHGIKVLGKRGDIPRLLKANSVDEVLVALPSASSIEIRKIVKIVRDSNHVKKITVLPSITDLIDGKVTLSDIQEVKIEDLLGREPVKIDFRVIKDFLHGKRVLVTGAGGSIGSELSRTILQFEPKSLMLLDIDETELFLLMFRLKSEHSEIVPILGDITDKAKMKSVYEKFKPEILLHSAAYKHVPMLERFPEDAVKTNVMGTKILAELAIEHKLEKFVYISTDKAINPTSVMGSTKRAGEEILRILNRRNSTRFICVRFGTVLGSRGSVVHLFRDQIKRGGPVTITHPEMKRYFMATSEAVLLVLEAAAAGEGGETYVLDMGEPIKIVDLAMDMIRLSGYEPDVDIPIVYSGLRPGEKLFEELLGAEEGSEPTEHAKIYKVRNSDRRD